MSTMDTSQTSSPPPAPPADTQRGRRLKYALNVVTMVAAALLLTVILNWWFGVRQFVRFDFTATRQYTLSEQTRKLLGGLRGDYRIVTLFSNTLNPTIDGLLQQVRDLADEYGRRSERIAVQHIDPARDDARLDLLYTELAERYAATLAPLREAIEEALTTIDRFPKADPQLVADLEALEQNPALGTGPIKEYVEQIRMILARLGQQIEEPMNRVRQSLGEPMPDYATARAALTQVLTDLDERVLTIVIDEFQAASKDGAMHASVRDQLLPLAKRLEELRAMIRPRLEALRAIQSSREYEDLRSQLTRQDVVAVLSDTQVRLVNVNDMFRQPDPTQAVAGQAPEVPFQGEEKLTGTLVSLQMKAPPMVVIVNTTGMPVLGRGNPQNTFNRVVDRLRSANIRVEEWNPIGGGTDPFGRPQPPQPAPQPQEGQKTIWVLPSSSPPDPRNPMAGFAVQNAFQTVTERLAQGDAALVMAVASGAAQFGAPDPAVDLLKTYGLTAQTDRIVFQEMPLGDERTQAVAQHEISQWPQEHDISRALRGMPGMFFLSSPIIFDTEQGATHWPLVVLRGTNLWAERDLSGIQTEPKRDEGEGGDAFTIAAAAERGETRIVAVADPVWATDFVVTLGGARILGSDEVIGARFPGNAELFVNSIYWLAGLDDLIAASPRSQDIRRIGALEPSSIIALRWLLLAGMPAVTILAGVGVWSVRRRG